MKSIRREQASRFLSCGLLVLALAPGRADAGCDAPRTLYRPADIATARSNIAQYAWAQRILTGWRDSTAFARQQDRDYFERVIPELTPGTRYGQNCPACVHPVRRRSPDRWRWNAADPDRLRCGRCDTVYPHPDYPETGLLECPRMGQTFTYYQTPAERALPPGAVDEERAAHALLGIGHMPAMTSMSALTRFHRVRWAWNQAWLAARLYALTGEVAYAERTAWILDRFARVFPGYLYRSYIGSYADWPPAEVAAGMGDPATPRGGRFPPDAVRHPYGLPERHRGKDARGEYSTLHNGFWGAGRLSTHGKGSDAGPLLMMTLSYDLTRAARYPDGNPVYDPDMHRRIIEDLIVAGCEDIEHWDDLSNKGIASRSVSAAVGILLDQPDRVRRGLEGFEQVLATRYHPDGFYGESPGYAAHNFSNMSELPDLLRGYSDPPGYLPADGQRIERYDPFAMDLFRLALESLQRASAPGGLNPVIGDTAHDRRLSPRFLEILAARRGGAYAGMLETFTGRSLARWGGEYSLWFRDPGLSAPEGPRPLPLQSEWFPGWHVAVLRGGRPADGDTALFVVGNEHHRTLRTSHRHADILGLSYYALGRELVSDRGYFSGSGHRTPDGRVGQTWTRSTLSHNLVVVDESDQDRRRTGSSLELFGVVPGVEIVQLSGIDVYPQCEQYRRTCIQAAMPGGGYYLVDIFRVTGGRIHQYSFHAQGVLAGILPDETEWRPAALSRSWSPWLREARETSPDRPLTWTWRQQDAAFDLVLLPAGSGPGRVLWTEAPGWRHHDEAREGRPPIAQILSERRAADGEASLSSVYTAVMAAYTAAASPVLSARRIAAQPAADGAVALEVRFDGRTDYLYSSLDQEKRSFGPVTAAGAFAFVSVDAGGAVLQAYLLGGTRLACGEAHLDLPHPFTTLDVASAAGRSFHLTAGQEAAWIDSARFVLADGPPPQRPGIARLRTGYDIESATASTITVRDYPVVASDTVTVLHSARWAR